MVDARLMLSKTHAEAVFGVAFSPDRKAVLSASWDNSVVVSDAQTGKEIARFTGHKRPVYALAVTTDGLRVASSGGDKVVRIWQLDTLAQLAVLEGHTDTVRTLAWSQDSRLLASAGWDKQVRVWEADTNAVLYCFEAHRDWVYAVAFSSDCLLLASASKDGTARLWDLKAGKEYAQLTGHTGSVSFVAFVDHDKSIVTASRDNTVRYWDVSKKPKSRKITTKHKYLNTAAVSPDGSCILTGDSNGDYSSIYLALLQTGEELAVISEQCKSVNSLAFSNDGQWFAAGGDDNQVRIWWTPAGAQQHMKLAKEKEEAKTLRRVSSTTGAGDARRQSTLSIDSNDSRRGSAVLSDSGSNSGSHSRRASPTAIGIETPVPTSTPPPLPALHFETATPDSSHRLRWQVEEVLTWLKQLSLDDSTIDAFRTKQVTGFALNEMTTDDALQLLGVSKDQDRATLLPALRQLRSAPVIESDLRRKSSQLQSPITQPRMMQVYSMPALDSLGVFLLPPGLNMYSQVRDVIVQQLSSRVTGPFELHVRLNGELKPVDRKMEAKPIPADIQSIFVKAT